MVAGEVGEHRRAELQAEHALLIDAVRADLHHRLPAAGVAHLREHTVDVDRLRRGLERRHAAVAEVVADRAEQADLLVAVEKMPHEVRDRRLAVRAGDAHDAEVAVGKAVVALRDAGEHRARIGHLDERDLRRRGDRQARRNHGHRAPVDRLVDVGRAVGAQARQREEQGAGHDAAAVHHQSGDGPVEGAPHGDDFLITDVVGKFRGHFKNAIAGLGIAPRRSRGAGGEGVNERVILREIADHCRPPSMTSKRRFGSYTGLMSRYWMSCSATCLNAGAAIFAP